MIPVLGLIIGIVIGLLVDPVLPQVVQPYLPIAIVAALDALAGAFRAYLEGNFTDRVFVVSFISNSHSSSEQASSKLTPSSVVSAR